jgi:NodT family efflux transporter outer membrane factor (OMF) lipoprotein
MINVKTIRRLSAALAVLLSSGCMMTGPDYSTPDADIADAWHAADPIVKTGAVSADWWQAFNDPTLNGLIDNAYQQNLPLRIAGLRVLEARAVRGIAAGQFWLQVQEINSRSTAIGLSNEFQTGGAGSLPKRHYKDFSLGFDAVWELDFWGRFRRGVESADANLQATVGDYDNILVTLIADVAATYVEIRAFEERIALAQSNITLQKETLAITETRLKNGVSTELDVLQAKSNLTNTQALVPSLEQGLIQTRNRLSILLGVTPGVLDKQLGAAAKIPSAPAELAVGIPADLLRRRPDIRSAERVAAAQSAQIGIAKTDLLPHFALIGTIGMRANQFDDMFDKQAVTSGVGPGISWSILNYGRIRNNIRVQDARFEALITAYRDTVLRANAEAENALATFLKSRQRVGFLVQSVDAARRSVVLARLQYTNGTVDFVRLLDAETLLVLQQDNLTASRRDVARGLIALYKALGGGWEIRNGKEFVPESTRLRMHDRTNWGDVLSPGYSTGSDLGFERPKD